LNVTQPYRTSVGLSRYYFLGNYTFIGALGVTPEDLLKKQPADDHPSLARRRRQFAAVAPSGRRGRAAVIERIWQTAERQVDEIDRRLSESGLERNERDSGVRTLAIVAKTLRDLAVFDEEGKARGRGPRGGQTPKDDDDESVPRNIDDLRRALTQKLDAFVAARADRVPDDAE
jgi:hypothetical protein